MIQIKRGKTSNWLKTKTKLAEGQPGYDKDRHKIKIGDGDSTWAELPYASGLSAEEILSSEKEAKARRAAATLLNPLAALLDSPAVITYGTDSPDSKTIGQLYLQHYDTEPEVDYVVETGVDGIWTYRKWKSGVAECCGTLEITSAIQSAFENNVLYHSNTSMSSLSYPLTFTSIPSESASVLSASNIVWLAGKTKNTKNKTGTYALVSPNSCSSAKYYITLHVTGHWK